MDFLKHHLLPEAKEKHSENSTKLKKNKKFERLIFLQRYNKLIIK